MSIDPMLGMRARSGGESHRIHWEDPADANGYFAPNTVELPTAARLASQWLPWWFATNGMVAARSGRTLLVSVAGRTLETTTAGRIADLIVADWADNPAPVGTVRADAAAVARARPELAHKYAAQAIGVFRSRLPVAELPKAVPVPREPVSPVESARRWRAENRRRQEHATAWCVGEWLADPGVDHSADRSPADVFAEALPHFAAVADSWADAVADARITGEPVRQCFAEGLELDGMAWPPSELPPSEIGPRVFAATLWRLADDATFRGLRRVVINGKRLLRSRYVSD